MVGAGATFFRNTLVNVAGERIAMRLRTTLFSSIMGKRTAFFDKNRTGELMSRMAADTQVAAKGVTETLSMGLRSTVSALGGSSLLLYLCPQLFSVVMLVIPPIGFAAVQYGRFVRNLSRQVQDSLADANATAEECIASVRIVRAFGGEQREVEAYTDRVSTVLQMSQRTAVARGVFFGGVSLGINASLLAVLGYGGILVNEGAMTAGDLTSFALYSVTVGAGFSGLSSVYGDMMKAVGSSQRVFEIVDGKPLTAGTHRPKGAPAADGEGGVDKAVDSSKSGVAMAAVTSGAVHGEATAGARQLAAMEAAAAAGAFDGFDPAAVSLWARQADGPPGNCNAAPPLFFAPAAADAQAVESAAAAALSDSSAASGAAGLSSEGESGRPPIDVSTVSFRDVGFSYPLRPEAPIFQNVSFDVPVGSTVAIVGTSGSGKSTILSLIERLYEPSTGQVVIGGKCTTELDAGDLRRAVGFVAQEPVLFATDIATNIRYGMEGATDAQVEAAARAAYAHEFIERLPEGYGTYVGEKGMQLSGGQKQRVAIARAIVREPALLLLDEATSALDGESEQLVQAALSTLSEGGGRTTVIVAHRLATVVNADKIIVLQGGCAVEEGTHEELLAKGGVYSLLVAPQLK